MIASLIQRSKNCVDRGRQRKNDIVFPSVSKEYLGLSSNKHRHRRSWWFTIFFSLARF